MDAAPTSEMDVQFMRAALALAERGVGLASPNPTVGCVLVKEGRIVGRGLHQYDLRDHAEIAALKDAGAEAARGATAYVTLEPCSHFGRTPPCARALMEAAIRRVVMATLDANPAVHGRGLSMLRAAGIETTVGVCERDARALNFAFARFIRTRLPFVTLKIAATLDGRIAPSPGLHPASSAFPITGSAARAEAQRLRHSHDALLTGIGTVLADDPLLTDRSGLPRRRPLLRIVLDSQLRLPAEARLLREAPRSVVVVTRSADATKRRALARRGVHLLTVEAQGEGGLSLAPVLRWMGEQNLTSVLIEAGARLNRSALLANAVDRLWIAYAPFFLGPDALPMFAEGTSEARWPRLADLQIHRFGEDFAIESLLRDPWV